METEAESWREGAVGGSREEVKGQGDFCEQGEGAAQGFYCPMGVTGAKQRGMASSESSPRLTHRLSHSPAQPLFFSQSRKQQIPTNFF